MKKIISLLFLFNSFVFFAQITICPPCNFEEVDEIKNKTKLKNAKIIKYETQIGFNDLDSISKRIFSEYEITMKFEDGDLIEYIEYDIINGKKKKPTISTFTYENNKLQNIEFNDLQYPSRKQRQVFKYNNKNINRFFYGYDYELFKKTYKVNVKYDKIIQYKTSNNKIVEVYEDNDGINSREYYKYNLKGDEIYSEVYGVVAKTTYIYDKKGNIIKESSKNNYNKGGYSISKYDNENNLIEKKFYTLKNNLSRKNTYKYHNNNLISEIYNSYDNNLVDGKGVTNYKYDEFGNWIKKELIENDLPKYLIVRLMEYY